MLRHLTVALLLAGCGGAVTQQEAPSIPPSRDGGPSAVEPDSGDSQDLDSGTPDAGHDAGLPAVDAGTPDAGSPDAGQPCGHDYSTCCPGADPCGHADPGFTCDSVTNTCEACGYERAPACSTAHGDPMNGCFGSRVVANWATNGGNGAVSLHTSLGCVTPGTVGVMPDYNGNHQCGYGSGVSPSGYYEYACISPVQDPQGYTVVYCANPWPLQEFENGGSSWEWGVCP